MFFIAASCTYCADLFAGPTSFASLFSTGVEYIRDRGSLKATKNDGCNLCSILFELCPAVGMQTVTSKVRFEFRLQMDGRILRVSRSGTVFSRILEFPVVSEDSVLSPAIPLMPNRSDYNRGTSNAFAQVWRWVAQCNQIHKNCATGNTLLPSRVLDISSAPKFLRLKVTKGEYAPYAALSYCWGTSPPVVTTSTSVIGNIRNISFEELPQSLQDAIKVTRYLGIKYLWIDALCILQDSVPDKEREMASMRQIFQNAYLTIVAACASSSEEGFLNATNGHAPIARLPVRNEDGDMGHMLLLQKETTHAPEPLHERGWTLQEVVLSPRVLIYGNNRVVWKCGQGEHVDVAGTGIFTHERTTDWNGYCASAGLTTIRLNRQGKITRPRLSVHSPGIAFQFSTLQEKLPEIYRVWKLVVQDYSTRKLTNPMDKLPALSGIVSYFQHAMKDTYLAGLWQKHLLHDLSWASSGASRPPLWRAPSWSWMSVDGPITFRADRCELFQPAAEILDCEVIPEIPSAPFSRIRSGSLTLKGYLRPNVPNLNGMLAFARPTDPLYQGAYGEIILDADTGNPISSNPADAINGSLTSVVAPHGVFWCFMVARCFTNSTIDTDYELVETVWGLALDRRGEAFERVGYFIGNRDCISWFKNSSGGPRTITIV